MLDDLDTIQNFLNPEFIEIRGGNLCSHVVSSHEYSII